MLKRHGVNGTTVSSTAKAGGSATRVITPKRRSIVEDVTLSGADFVWCTLGGNDLLNPDRLACVTAKPTTLLV
jgi:hypothetical protein